MGQPQTNVFLNRSIVEVPHATTPQEDGFQPQLDNGGFIAQI